MDSGKNSKVGNKLLNLGYILKVEPKRLVNGLNMRAQTEISNAIQRIFPWAEWVDVWLAGLFTDIGKTGGGEDLKSTTGRNQESSSTSSSTIKGEISRL